MIGGLIDLTLKLTLNYQVNDLNALKSYGGAALLPFAGCVFSDTLPSLTNLLCLVIFRAI
jgi:hypothetical protein